MMKHKIRIFSVSIPIISTDGINAFEQTILFDKSPSREEVIEVISSWEEKDSPYHEESVEVINRLMDSINQVKEWVVLDEDQIYDTTQIILSFSNGEKYCYPFAWKREVVYLVEKSKGG